MPDRKLTIAELAWAAEMASLDSFSDAHTPVFELHLADGTFVCRLMENDVHQISGALTLWGWNAHVRLAYRPRGAAELSFGYREAMSMLWHCVHRSSHGWENWVIEPRAATDIASVAAVESAPSGTDITPAQMGQ